MSEVKEEVTNKISEVDERLDSGNQFWEKIFLGLQIVFDIAVPIKSLQEPIEGFSAKERAKLRLLRARVGYLIHLAIIPSTLHKEQYLFLAINILAIVGTAYGHFDSPRRAKRLIPLAIRGVLGGKNNL